MKRARWLSFAIIVGFFLGGFSLAAASPLLTELKKTFTPLTASADHTLSVDLTFTLELPLSLEAHLLSHFIATQDPLTGSQWSSYEQLRNDFLATPEDQRKFPLVDETGRFNSNAIKYWIERQLEQYRAPFSKDGSNTVNRVQFKIDNHRSVIDYANDKLTLVYTVTYEVTPTVKTATTSFQPSAFSQAIPRNLHKLYYQTLGSMQLQQQAIARLKAQQLPEGRLAWKAKTIAVKNHCLAEIVKPGVVDLEAFLDALNPQRPQCQITRSLYTLPLSITRNHRDSEALTYPEYHELFNHHDLSVLISYQECNEARYNCREHNLAHPKRRGELEAHLLSKGFAKIAENNQLITFRKGDANAGLRIDFYREQRPVHYQARFTELFSRYDVVFTNRLPMPMYRHGLGYTPQRYQIVFAKNVDDLGWDRLLPHLDIHLRNIDGIDVDVDELEPSTLMAVIGRLAAMRHAVASPDKAAPLSWQAHLGAFATDLSMQAGEHKQSRLSHVVAYFVRHNAFIPGQAADALSFTPGSREGYIELLNTSVTDATNAELSIDRHKVALYLSQQVGDSSASFAELRSTLQKICKDELTEAEAKSQFFARDCSPSTLLTSEKTLINGIYFPRSSVVRLFYGKSGVPFYSALSAPTKIGAFVYKPYYEDNGGLVYFHRKTGEVAQGHLAYQQMYRNLPLLGGKGKSAVFFHPNGTLDSAHLRSDTDITVHGKRIPLRGGWTGPHKISWYPTGEFECGYLSQPATIDGFPLAAVEPGARNVSHKKACFHHNGRLKSGVLARDFVQDGVTYPEGTSIMISTTGKLLSPLLQLIDKDQYFWDSQFPEGSIYRVNSKDGNPEWIRLAGPLTLKNHQFSAGVELTFAESGALRQVKVPAQSRAHVVFKAYSMDVPAGATLYFYNDGTPRGLDFTGTVTLAGMQFMPFELDDSDYEKGKPTFELFLHQSGRIAKGRLAEETQFSSPHYGSLSLQKGSILEIEDNGEVSAATLAQSQTLTYTVRNKADIPAGSSNCQIGSTTCRKELTFPGGTVLSFVSPSAAISLAHIPSPWQLGSFFSPGEASIRFDDRHQMVVVKLGNLGGRWGEWPLAAGEHRFYENGLPNLLDLAQETVLTNVGTNPGPTTLPALGSVAFHPNGQIASLTTARQVLVDGIEVPAGATLKFYPSAKREFVGLPNTSEFVIDGFHLFGNAYFYESGLLRQAFLSRDYVYGGVVLSGGENNSVDFYPDGTSILRGVAAQDTEVIAQDGSKRQINKGQIVEFDEAGNPFFE